MNPRLSRMAVARFAAPSLVLIAAIVSGTLFGVQLVVLTLASGALLLVIWLLWLSVQALAGQTELTFEEAFSLGARSAEEEQKRAVLRALKDLEYERSVGKISEQDYHEYSTRYRAEAKTLIQNLDEHLSQARKQVEQELERRLSKMPERTSSKAIDADPVSTADSQTDTGLGEAAAETEPERQAVGLICIGCGTKNEFDARFCKACGKSMAEGEEAKS